MSLRPRTVHTQHRGLVQTVAPEFKPVTPEELRTHLNHSELDYIEADDLISEASQYIEDMTGIAMITQTWRLALDAWPTGRGAWWDGVRQGSINELYSGDASLEMPRFPLNSIDTVTVYDEASTSTAVTIAATFDVDAYSKPGRMTLKHGAVWPIALRANNAIEIIFTCGYGANRESVPAPLRRAVKQLAGYLYENRGDCDSGSAYTKSGAQGIMNAYKVSRL